MRTWIAPAFFLSLSAFLVVQVFGQMGGSSMRVGDKVAKPKFGPEIKDIFFPDAGEKVGSGIPPGGPIVPEGNTGTKPQLVVNTPPVTPTVPPPASGEATKWSEVISAEFLEAEIKAQATIAENATRIAGPFKAKEYKTAQSAFSMLSIMFGVLAQYDEEIRWKENATGMRDELAKAAAACKTGDQYQAAKVQATSVGDLVRGIKIDVPAGQGTPAWSSLAEINAIMQRMELSQQKRMRPALASEADFKAEKEMIMHEASIMAVLAEVIQDKGFDAADNDDYQGWARSMKVAAIEIVTACKQDAHANATSNAAALGKACNDCHEGYR